MWLVGEKFLFKKIGRPTLLGNARDAAEQEKFPPTSILPPPTAHWFKPAQHSRPPSPSTHPVFHLPTHKHARLAQGMDERELFLASAGFWMTPASLATTLGCGLPYVLPGAGSWERPRWCNKTSISGAGPDSPGRFSLILGI